jgi:hypothetical protein
MIENGAFPYGLLAFKFHPDDLNIWIERCLPSEIAHHGENLSRRCVDIHCRRKYQALPRPLKKTHRFVRLCENSVQGSSRLTTNVSEASEIKI